MFKLYPSKYNNMPLTLEKITYYCFNNACINSVYNLNTVVETELNLNEQALTGNHKCVNCGRDLVSILSIEIKKACLNA